jgi:hypothetical protein
MPELLLVIGVGIKHLLYLFLRNAALRSFCLDAKRTKKIKARQCASGCWAGRPL